MDNPLIDIRWIAPDDGRQSPLNLHEMDDIRRLRGVTVQSRAGRAATMSAIADFLAMPSTGDLNITIWSGHGNEGGLLTSDGRILGGDWIGAQARLADTQLFVVGACYSGAPNEYLETITEGIAENGIDTIGFTIAADDEAASIYVTELVRALTAGVERADANRIAKRHAANINKATAASIRYHAGMMDGSRTIIRELREIKGVLTEHTEQFRVVNVRQDSLERRIDDCFSPPKPRRTRSTTKVAASSTS